MRTKISVALDGVELHALDAAIILQSVNEAAPGWNFSAADRAGGLGQRMTGSQKRYRDIVIQFALDERDPKRRMEILQAVAAWADGARDLTVSYRERQRLRVTLQGLTPIQGIEKWGTVYQITLRSYSHPMWMDQDETSAEISGNGSGVLRIAGNGGGKMCFRAVNSSGSVCASAEVSSGGRTITLTGMELASGETLILDYDAEDIQRIRAGSGSSWRSLLDKRTAASWDDILLASGANTVTVTSSAALSWTVYCFGRWIQ